MANTIAPFSALPPIPINAVTFSDTVRFKIKVSPSIKRAMTGCREPVRADPCSASGNASGVSLSVPANRGKSRHPSCPLAFRICVACSFSASLAASPRHFSEDPLPRESSLLRRSRSTGAEVCFPAITVYRPRGASICLFQADRSPAGCALLVLLWSHLAPGSPSVVQH